MRRLSYPCALAILLVGRPSPGAEVDLYDEEQVQEIVGLPISSVELVPAMEGVEDALAFFELEAGDRVTHELVWEMLVRMWLTGKVGHVAVFAEEIADGSVRLTVEYEYRLVIRDVDVRGNKRLGEGRITEIIGFRPHMEVFPDTLDEMEATLVEEYGLRGYPEVEIRLELESGDEPDMVDLTIRVDEGDPLRLREVSVGYEGREDPLDGPVPVFELRKALGLSDGDVYDQIRLEEGLAAIERELQDAGYLNVQAGPARTSVDEQERIDLSVPVREGRRIRFVIVGNHHQTDGEILEVMKPRMVLPLNAGIVEEMGMRVRDHYRSLGFIDVQVVLHQKEVPDENLRIYRLTVVEGPRVRVEHIGFEGNDEFSDKFLKKELVSFLYEEVPYDVVFSGLHFTTINDVLLSGGKGEVPGTESVTKPLAVWPPEWIFWREAYEEAVEHIEKLYISEGYLDAEVSPPAIHRDGDTMRVTLVIEEGVRTYVGEVRFDGNEALADEALAEVAMIAEGNPFSGLGVKDAESAILDAYAEEGYRFAQVETVVDFSEDSRSASVRYVIDEGPQVVVDEIVVRGNAQTSTSLIKDRIAFDVGDVFTQGRERKSLNRLHRLDIFRSVSMDMLEPSLPGARKTVVIEVVERKPQYLGLKGGASTADGVRGSMEYAYRNLFGYAVDFHFRIALNYRLFFVGVTQEFRDWYLAMNLLDQLERNISVGLTLPHVPTIGNYFTFETSFAHLRRNANIYGITTNSLTASVLTGTGKRLNVTIQSGLESSSINANTEITEDLMNLEGLAARDRRALRVPQTDDPATFIVTSGRINLDFRDNPFTPTRGFSLNGSVSWIVSARPVAFTWYEPVTVDGRRVPNAPYRTEHDLSYAHHETAYSNLLKLYLDVTGYIKLGTPKVVLMLHAGGGIIVPLPEHTHTFPDRFFYLGGARSLRGVPEEALCAEDVYDQKRQCFQGGELMVIYKAELRTMLRGNFGLAFFVDAGNLWRGWDGRYGTRGVDGWYKVFYDLRYTAGAGIRYITPVGPINLDVGFLLNRHDDIGEPIGSFHFSIGTF